MTNIVHQRLRDKLYRSPSLLRPFLVDDTASDLAICALVMTEHAQTEEAYQSANDRACRLIEDAKVEFIAANEDEEEAIYLQEMREERGQDL